VTSWIIILTAAHVITLSARQFYQHSLTTQARNKLRFLTDFFKHYLPFSS